MQGRLEAAVDGSADVAADLLAVADDVDVGLRGAVAQLVDEGRIEDAPEDVLGLFGTFLEKLQA